MAGRRFAHAYPRPLLGQGLRLTIMRLASQVGYVKGIDLSPGEIAEAQTRYQQVLRKYGALLRQLLHVNAT